MAILLIGDVQGNLPALDAVLTNEAAQRVDAVLCLGDVASGPQPGRVIERLRRLGAGVVRGNMDEVLVAPPAPTPAEGEVDRFAAIDRWGSARLTEAQRTWLASLPRTLRFELPRGRTLLACHGSPRSNEDVIASTTPAARVRALCAGTDAEIVVVGHMHEPMLRGLDDRLLLHPGSVGWPKPLPGGKRPLRAEFAVLESAGGELRVAFHRVEYARERLRRAVLRSGMPHGEWYLAHWREA